MSEGLWIAIAVIAVLVVAALIIGLVRYRRRQISLRRSSESPTPIDRSGGYSASSGISFTQSSVTTAPPPAPAAPPTIDTTGLPGVGDDAALPRDSVKRPIEDVRLPEPPVAEPPAAAETVVDEPAVEPTPAPAEVTPTAPDLSGIAPTEGRLERLRGRLAKSQNALGRSMLGLLGGGDLDEESWEEVEDTLLIADLGPVVTSSVIEQLRSRLAAATVRTEADARAVLRDVLISELDPGLDRSIKALPHADKPSVLLVVGVNGTGKTTTVGKLARVLVADGRRVVLGAADTFRAAAADQLQSWASRVGADVVRGPEGADPASVAFDAVDKGIEAGADVVVIDTAGRLHTKTGLMDELGKVKRVVSKRAAVDEVLLVLDATIGQNGLAQARVFAEVVDITGLVLTKLDGTAKGGIVFRVQQELGVPVKLVGLGEGPDDLAPFEPAAFVDALLG
ncbi:signal recognition particle-docking protein FtsY [Mycolicibacterium aichiense]|uniref:Signal recognition particle receptor FtsY n=1 Tax=Mycolicibacterium aichiense TaxID=1799 RepID=A0AAD1MBS3_9MYCO|nr:signal recognition particle-docking protein FtsY [Mycolicibacterium aichiense]MCV7018085.1 signal recognition particle-docking protein FtsY [Mycolicibacterium aichiense]BBX07036.1 signal recognition particle receptor FtsY [Mycolicibacterium aichiense]STZ80852.1 signal recognition particle-docking protein FtsY [Mycolicibacterium aichiense]